MKLKKMKLRTEKRYIDAGGRKMKIIILRPKEQQGKLPGILWMHGGGYMLGMSEMVYFSCGKMLAEKYGAVVVSPEYTLAGKKPYPAALTDCYDALTYMNSHRDDLGIDRIIVGGESAGGGLAAALCIYARDRKEIGISYQIPLYPMLDCEDTESSRDNHGKGWNTRWNHWGWRHYLDGLYGSGNVPAYASPSRETDYAGLPPCYTFVCEGEPFYVETLIYVKNLQEAGVDAHVDVYKGDIHCFDAMFWTRQAREARRKLCKEYEAFLSRQREDPQ